MAASVREDPLVTDGCSSFPTRERGELATLLLRSLEPETAGSIAEAIAKARGTMGRSAQITMLPHPLVHDQRRD
ncbi:MAG TPA: hypothetical protein VHN14_35650, partial [Kofleriaceae bacterium]|nr:hypothetical protein [Kofleriaceae bacterium]